MKLDLNKILEQVCNSATDIGAYLKNEQSKLKASAIEMKGLRDYVSYVDKEAEKQLVSALKNLIPNAGFLTEEDTVEQEGKDYTWIIDPLDGKETILGVVYDPLANEMFTAIKGEKALLNNEPIDVSKKDELKNSFIGFGIPYEMDTNTAAILKNTWEHFGQASFRLNGAAALELCFVACGRYDAFFHSGLSPWDVAAGAFILQQAGGKITDYNNGHNYIFGKEVVATNSLIHTDIMKNIINLNKAD